MAKFKQYVLPVAIVLGLLLHSVCGRLAFLTPWLIFTILLFTFTAVDLKKLRPSRFDFTLMAYQIVAATACYLGVRALGGDKIIAEGLMLGALTPVAASSTVVSCMLGARRETVTGYTIFGNLMVALVAPIFFTLIGEHPEHSLEASFLLMLGKIASTLALPFFIALLLQMVLPKVNEAIARRTSWSYYVWAVALLITLGQTIDFIFLHGEGHWHIIIWLGALSLAFCAFQFWLGRKIGRRFGDVVSGAQMTGQKNSAMGIWMAGNFLNPLASVFMAFYSVYQNLYNAYQLSRLKDK